MGAVEDMKDKAAALADKAKDKLADGTGKDDKPVEEAIEQAERDVNPAGEDRRDIFK